MKGIRNEKGLTIIETLATTFIIATITVIFVTYLFSYNSQQKRLKEEIIASNLTIEQAERYFGILSQEGITLPLEETLTKEVKNTTYTIKVTAIEQVKVTNPQWSIGNLAEVTVEVSTDATTKTLSTQVYTK